ncbi:MAG: 50S ribosomal protein L9 [Candidatus Rokubacteria bacterium]|nr:50S ribosomal protein L9 [Candidatus Rokubacteria bacterium]
MKVILLDDIPKLGRRGEVRDVAEGYARNYLLPHRLVLPASPQNLKQIEQIKQHQEVRSQRAKAEAEGQAKGIEVLTFSEVRQASEEGRLYGSVGVSDVAAFLARGDRLPEGQRHPRVGRAN